MRFIPTRLHGVIDYPTGLLIAASPWLFNFAYGGVAQWLPVFLGLGIMLMSLVTDYETSLTRVVPMPLHLAVDGLGGALLAASPWLFGFADRTYLPHLVLGLAEIGAALMTQTRPGPNPVGAVTT
jgi:hypothetical protein